MLRHYAAVIGPDHGERVDGPPSDFRQRSSGRGQTRGYRAGAFCHSARETRAVWWLLAILWTCGGCDTGPRGPHGTQDNTRSPVRAASGSSDESSTTIPASPPDSLQSDDIFEDVTDRSGVQFAYRNGREAGRFCLIESFGGGAALFDFDGDSDLDLFVTGGGTIAEAPSEAIGGLVPNLQRNETGWKFRDVTAAAGLGQPADYSQGCAVTDFNADGFPDLLVCCYGRSRLYRNQGDGQYLEVGDASVLPAQGWGAAAAFGDLDRDGFPDLMLARYNDWTPQTDIPCYNPQGVRDLCGPSTYPGTVCQFLHNDGAGNFVDWSEQIGLQGNVRGMGVVAADLNVDGWLDFYITSDESPKQLYWGAAQLPLVQGAAEAGVALNEWGRADGSMGVDVGDFDGNGLPDLFVTNFENEDHALFKNLGDGLFMHATAAVGLSGMSRIRSGFGTAFVDFDSDGWLDLFVLNGNPIYRVAQSPYAQPPQLFHNQAGRRFVDVSTRGGTFFRERHAGRGCAIGDIDDDGALDFVAVPVNAPVRILRNRLTPENFVRVELHARLGEPDATGARVTCTGLGRPLVRFAVRGGGFYSQSDARIVFPLEASLTEAEIMVEWPGRSPERFSGLAVRQTHVLIEGQGQSATKPTE